MADLGHPPQGFVWPTQPPIDFEQLNIDDVEIFYDADIDTLDVHFYGTRVPSVVNYMDRHTALLIERGTGRPVGIMIEGFIKHVLPESPDLAGVLNVATFLHQEQTSSIRDYFASIGFEPFGDTVRESMTRTALRQLVPA